MYVCNLKFTMILGHGDLGFCEITVVSYLGIA